MPVSLGITANPSALSPGPNQGTITISAPDASPFTQTITVSLTTTVAGQPSLNASRGTHLRFRSAVHEQRAIDFGIEHRRRIASWRPTQLRDAPGFPPRPPQP